MLPQVVKPEDGELFELITQAFAATAAAGSPAKEVQYADLIWRRVNDNGWKYVQVGNAGTIDARYSEQTFSTPTNRPARKRKVKKTETGD